MRNLVFAPSARDDLQAIASYFEKTGGAEVAINVVSKIRDKCRFLASTLGTLGTAREEILAGLRSLPVPPHVLLFRYRDGSLEVVRILHERQDLDRAFEP